MATKGYAQQHGLDVQDAIDIEDFARGADITITAAAQATPALIEGIYDVLVSVDAFIKVGPTAGTGLTVVNGYMLKAGNVVSVLVRDGSQIGVIGTTGSFQYHKVK